MRVVDTVRDTTGLLFDTFHLTTSSDDLTKAIDDHGSLVAHVQLADAPGRGEPGAGPVGFAGTVEQLRRAGYRGKVAGEYRPTASTEDSPGWTAAIPRLGW